MKKFLLILAAVFCCTLGVNAQETPDYFCLTFHTTATVSGRYITFYRAKSSWTIPSLEYKINNGEWTKIEMEGSSTSVSTPTLNDGDKVYIRATGTGEEGNKTFSESTTDYFYMYTTMSNTELSVSGNIMSLLDRDNFENLDSVPPYAFCKLFGYSSNYSKKITDVSGLRLPATNISEGCYYYMFANCAIKVAPALPAHELKKYCYAYMFNGCTSLSSIEVNFKEWPYCSYKDDGSETYNGTYNWVSNVPDGGEFICPAELSHATSSDFGISRIPGSSTSHWAIYDVAPEITLNDAEPFTRIRDRDMAVTYNRTFDVDKVWQALYVPFSIDITSELLSKCDIADIYMVSTKGSGSERPEEDGLNVVVVKKFREGDKTEPHTPYFIRAKAIGNFTFTQENTLVKGATTNSIDCSTTKDKYEFIGSYDGETLSPADGVFYIIDAEGYLTKISEETTLPCNRWYMKKTSRQQTPVAGAILSPMMPILTIGEDDTTGIIGLDEVKTNANGKLYNMMGVAVEAGRASLPAGVYIQHGKKFIVK
ncbi:MAG: hypothetical protein KBS94_04135 [Prevotella sp.]|nr:hypothetical protein [Candidatus Equicola faecalis]